MDNPQHYQPLSHALNPPLQASQSRSPYPTSAVYTPPTRPATAPGNNSAPAQASHREEEQEEDEQDDDDEGVVEEQLELNDNDAGAQGSAPASPPRHNAVDGTHPPLQIVHDTSHTGEKRRPGRPRGSKNRKPRAPRDRETNSAAPVAVTGPPPHPDINSQNQQYYEFQWRILNLCAEFYGAAEELVKTTNPLVIAQCYHMGPNAKLDPLVMLAEAKRICDTLLANPAQLVANPPPPIYPVLPTLYSSGAVHPPPASATPVKPAGPAAVITNPQSFVVPLGGQPGYTAPQFPVYAPGQYPTTPYYQYPYPPPPGYYPPVQPAPTGSSGPSTTPAVAQAAPSTSSTPAVTQSNVINSSGSWADDEVERLKRLAEESKSHGGNGETDWEYVIRHFGDKRTRHQILIKATNLGMKESTTRGVKRRRENEPAAESSNAGNGSPAMASLPSQPLANNGQASMQQPTGSPSHSSTPTASPALQNQRPSSAKGNPATAQPNSMPWPMPTVAQVNTSTSILPSNSTTPNPMDPQRTSYYRPRPNQGDNSNKSTVAAQQQHASAGAMHHYNMYTANGRDSR